LKRAGNREKEAGVEIRLVAAFAAHRRTYWFRGLRKAAELDRLFRLPQRMRTAMCRGGQSTLDKTERPTSISSGSTASGLDEYMPVWRVPFLAHLLEVIS
jgi:hypothetical protein